MAIDLSGFEFGLTHPPGHELGQPAPAKEVCPSSMSKSPTMSSCVCPAALLASAPRRRCSTTKATCSSTMAGGASHAHATEVVHFVVFMYDGHVVFTVKDLFLRNTVNIFDESHHHSDEND
jgi:hypothetical protein